MLTPQNNVIAVMPLLLMQESAVATPSRDVNLNFQSI